MAVIRYSTFDKTVQTIADRNNITNKVDGMTVVVLDAISDINAGPGKAVYRWEGISATWILVSKVGIDTISFATEEITIVDGKVVPTNIILDNQIWGIFVMNGTLIVAQPRIEDLTINYTGISGLTQYNGYKLRFTYAYGTVTAQMSSIISDLETQLIERTQGLLTVEELDSALSSKIDRYDISNVGYNTGVKRGTKDIFGIEVDLGLLPNTGIKDVAFTFNTLYNYWVDVSNSYASSADEVITLPYLGFIGDEVSVKLDRLNNKIVIITAKDRTSLTGKLVILYTK